MAILDFLSGGRGKRARAKRLLAVAGERFDRLHDSIRTSGTAEVGPEFEAIWKRFADCRVYRPADLGALPAVELAALDRFVAGQIASAAALLQEAKAALAQVQAEWRGDDLVAAAAGGGLRAIAQLHELARASTAQERLHRTAALVEVDLACADVKGELSHIAKSPSLFW